jgi:hypothetical protein
MKILRVQAHHVMRLEDIDLDLTGHNLYLVGGKNAQGKTSTLTAILMALCGKRKMDWPKSPLKEGEDEGWVKLDLSGCMAMGDPKGYTAELHFIRKPNGQVVDEFRLLDSAGEESPSPRDLLNDLFQMRAFDPLEFDRMKEADQRKVLAGIIGLDIEQYEEDRKAFYESRTANNRLVKREATLLDEMPQFPMAPDKPVSLAALLQRKQAWQHRENDRQQKEFDRREALQDAATAKEKHHELMKQIEELKRKAAEQQVRYERSQASATEAQEWLNTNLTIEDGPALDQAINDAESVNEMVRKNEDREKAAQKLATLVAESDRLTAEIKNLDETQKQAVLAAKWPVPGLGIDDKGVLLNGLPWSDASRSQRIEASIRIGMALKPTFKTFVCQDASDLDNDTLASLDRVLQATDYQLIAEIVTRNPTDEMGCAVVIEDGKVKP